MEAPDGAPAWVEIVTAEERPDLWERARTERSFDDLWPDYNMHGTHASLYFGDLVPRFAHLQALFVDRRTNDLMARARTIPFSWDASLEDLPSGIDAVWVSGRSRITEGQPRCRPCRPKSGPSTREPV